MSNLKLKKELREMLEVIEVGDFSDLDLAVEAIIKLFKENSK